MRNERFGQETDHLTVWMDRYDVETEWFSSETERSIWCSGARQGLQQKYMYSLNIHNKTYLLGQLWVLHVRDDEEKSAQAAPPYCGAGAEQVRALDWMPPPHVTVQLPQLPHAAQFPSTTTCAF